MKTELPIQSSTKELKGKHEQLRALIEAHPFTRGFGASHLATLADCAMKTEFAQGELLFREGDIANFFYGTWLREQCQQDPDFGCELYKRVAFVVISRLQSARRRLLEIAYPAGTTTENLLLN